MSETAASAARRTRRIEEAILEVDGVIGVKVWELPGRVEIGVRISPADTAPDVLKRVQDHVEALRDGAEVWDVGVLSES
jgi:hypothetical protein